MPRKEINVFSVSFLDLLSGALGAVLILFIIIPKMNAEQQNAVEQLTELNVQVEQLADLIEQARNSIPAELYEQIQQQVENMQTTIDELNNQVQQLQQHVAEVEQENEQLREQLERTQQQLQEAQREIAQNRNISDGKIFGTTAKLGVICMWPENIDVDLHVKNLVTGEICNFAKQSTNFGTLMEDVISRDSSDDDRYEVFYQSRIIPGRYLIYVNIYKEANLSNANSATVDGYVVMFPGAGNQKKIPFRQIRLTTRGENVTVGTLEVTENNINLTQ